MNVWTGNEAVQFHFWEYINRIFGYSLIHDLQVDVPVQQPGGAGSLHPPLRHQPLCEGSGGGTAERRAQSTDSWPHQASQVHNFCFKFPIFFSSTFEWVIVPSPALTLSSTVQAPMPLSVFYILWNLSWAFEIYLYLQGRRCHCPTTLAQTLPFNLRRNPAKYIVNGSSSLKEGKKDTGSRLDVSFTELYDPLIVRLYDIYFITNDYFQRLKFC